MTINYGIFICLCLFTAALALLQVGQKIAYMFRGSTILKSPCINFCNTRIKTSIKKQYSVLWTNSASSLLSSEAFNFYIMGRGYIMSCNLAELQDQVWILQSWLSALLWEHLKTFKTQFHVRISSHKIFIKELIPGVCEQIIASNPHASKAHVGHN